MAWRFWKGGPTAHKSPSIGAWETDAYLSFGRKTWGCLVAARVLSEKDYEEFESARTACECPSYFLPHRHTTGLLPLET